jgi:hypothetical protein
VDEIFGSESTTTQTYEPFSGVRKEWYEGFQPFVYSRATKPITYSGKVAAGLNPTQQAIISRLAGYTDNPTLAAYARGDYIDPTKNPYVQGMVEQVKKKTAETWGDIGDQINTAANKTGFWSGSGRFGALEDAQKDLAEAESGALASLFNTAYQQGVSNMLQAGQQQQSAAQAALQGGNVQYQVEQAAAQAEYEKWLAEHGLQNDAISQYLYFLVAGKNPSTTTTTQESGLGGIMGSLAGGWASTWGKK